jgi:DNA-directed RNA polymerase specialized sigma24 family protein
MPPTIHDTLLQRLAANTNSKQRWDEFDELYKGRICSLVRSLGIDYSECADVWQETLAAMREDAFKKFDRDRGRFYTFLIRIAKNCAISHLRRRDTRTRFQTQPEVSEDQDSFADTVADNTLGPDARAELDGEIYHVKRVLFAFADHKLFAKRTIDCVWEQIESDAYGEPSKSEIALKYHYITSIDQRIPNSMYEARSSMMRDLRLALQFTRDARERINSEYTEDLILADAINVVRETRSQKNK